jgi:3-methyladenine DNA glycosylase AlkD
MKTVAEVLKRLEELGSEQTRKTFSRHGADVSKMFGVKVADLKLVAKQIKGNQVLAMELFDSGNLDAQYLAGIMGQKRRLGDDLRLYGCLGGERESCRPRIGVEMDELQD